MTLGMGGGVSDPWKRGEDKNQLFGAAQWHQPQRASPRGKPARWIPYSHPCPTHVPQYAPPASPTSLKPHRGAGAGSPAHQQKCPTVVVLP